MPVTIFRNRINPDHAEEYYPLADEIAALADAMPGFVSRKTFTAEDGERVTIVEFADDDSHMAWAHHPRHREAQKAGRERLYVEYELIICDVRRRKAHRNQI